jgi:predicted neuraminidase
MDSWSNDAGRTWSKFKPTTLSNPNSGIDAVTLSDGRHLLVYNDIGVGKSKWGDRNILNLAISKNGIDWEAVALLENDPDKDSEYSYPAIIQDKNGLVHITYTWNRKLIKHVVIDVKNIKTKPIINGEWPEL